MPENGVLWNQFLIGLASGQEESKAVRADVSVQALKHLDGAAADTLRPMVSGLCDLIRFGPRQRIADVDGTLLPMSCAQRWPRFEKTTPFAGV